MGSEFGDYPMEGYSQGIPPSQYCNQMMLPSTIGISNYPLGGPLVIVQYLLGTPSLILVMNLDPTTCANKLKKDLEQICQLFGNSLLAKFSATRMYLSPVSQINWSYDGRGY